MELTESQLVEIVKIFRKVTFGKITFDLSPERDYIQYRVEESHRIPSTSSVDLSQPRPNDLKRPCFP